VTSARRKVAAVVAIAIGVGILIGMSLQERSPAPIAVSPGSGGRQSPAGRELASEPRSGLTGDRRDRQSPMGRGPRHHTRHQGLRFGSDGSTVVSAVPLRGGASTRVSVNSGAGKAFR
jgi:hypothetical protein